eukprot:12913357-Prorocentrum_lima.AAC.1
MLLDTCITETGDLGHDWRIKRHIPIEMREDFVHAQESMFKDKWGHHRPDVAAEWSDTYHRKGDLNDGV